MKNFRTVWYWASFLHVCAPLCHSFINLRRSAAIEGQIKKRTKRETRLQRRNWSCMLLQGSRREEKSPIWYLIGIDRVEKRNFFLFYNSGQIHTFQTHSDARHLWLPACVCACVVCQDSEACDTRRRRRRTTTKRHKTHCESHIRGWEVGRNRQRREGTGEEESPRRRNIGRNENREVLIFLQRWFIHSPCGSNTLLARKYNKSTP